MDKPNQPISVYKGLFSLKFEDDEVIVDGNLIFNWFPNIGLAFSGVVQSDFTDAYKLVSGSPPLQLFIKDLIVGGCYITQITTSSYIELQGLLQGEVFKGDRSVEVSIVNFSIPNLRDVSDYYIDEFDTNAGRGLVFEDGVSRIVIEKKKEFNKLSDALEKEGGYLILYTGYIIKNRGSISSVDANKILHCFSVFINFLNGKRASPLLREGVHDNELIWCDYTKYFNDQHRYVYSWISSESTEELNNLWKRFSLLWRNEDNMYFLKDIVHWYTEANMQSGFTDGAIIMAQTGLELIYNWLIYTSSFRLRPNHLC